MLDLVYFEHRAGPIRQAIAAGIDTFIVDWEWRGKGERQEGAATEIDPGTADDLADAVAAAATGGRGAGRVCCRLNGFGAWTPAEVDAAVDAGAGCLLLPMVRRPAEVETFLGLVGGRCRAGILVETVAAVAAARELAALPLDRVYVGLNDLALERRSASLFAAVVDGTVERVREAFDRHDFGFAGVTVVDGGRPVPCPLLLAEMERLGASFSFCRRSFKRDVAGRDVGVEVARIRALWERLAARDDDERRADRRRLHEVVAGLAAAPAAAVAGGR